MASLSRVGCIAALGAAALLAALWAWPQSVHDDDFAKVLSKADRELLYGGINPRADDGARAKSAEEVRLLRQQVAALRGELAHATGTRAQQGEQEADRLRQQIQAMQTTISELTSDAAAARREAAEHRSRASSSPPPGAAADPGAPEPGPERAKRMSAVLRQARADLFEYANKVSGRIRSLVTDSQAAEKLANVFLQAFMNTVDRTMWVLPSQGSLLVVTGDIIDMWLRDSAAQVEHYVRCCAARSSAVTELVVALLHEHSFLALQDPYANAFRGPPRPGDKISPPGLKGAWGPPPKGNWWDREYKLRRGGYTATANYELDSFAYTLRLSHLLWKTTGAVTMFDAMFRAACMAMLVVWRREQRHEERSLYRYAELKEKQGLENSKTVYTGMTWQGFRPSDDPCKYHYNVPGNMMASVALKQMSEILSEVYRDSEAAADATALQQDIDKGIARYGTVAHGGDRVYAYEVDGLGNYLIADDANVPSLLSIPYLGWEGGDPQVLQRTREVILSKANPWYFSGTHGAGIGSPHTPKGRFWPMALIIEGWTTDSRAERLRLLSTLLTTDAGKGLMHESVDANNPRKYSRDFFAWCNSLFGGWVADMVEQGTLPGELVLRPQQHAQQPPTASRASSVISAAMAHLRGAGQRAEAAGEAV
eukprot:TRINITY_DN50619_c0_g1_i1.p1 TRINITY_DN50619_c0_g1~~TRINITY_DN50619_c0_g1_i1.p1  ORF type:complete len:681 (+),score=221.50 TRINITY_DN50619_c0_g1_i1:85-2043(+)